jgi:glycosyltransferase involved in cell wall biosynthesis
VSLDAIVVLGDHWREWVAENTEVSPAKISVVNNPIELAFEREALQWPPGGSEGIFFVGSLGTRKGLFDIIEALALLKRRGVTPPVTIAGPEEGRGARAALEGLLAEQGLEQVTLPGPVLGPEKLALFKENGIFLFPSHKENFPLVVIESAAAGRAIITTPVGALPEFFRHDRSVLYVQPGNAEEIAAAIESLLGDRDKRRELGAAAREAFVTSLTRERICSSLDHVYQRVLGPET